MDEFPNKSSRIVETALTTAFWNGYKEGIVFEGKKQTRA